MAILAHFFTQCWKFYGRDWALLKVTSSTWDAFYFYKTSLTMFHHLKNYTWKRSFLWIFGISSTTKISMKSRVI